jgi:hypothetical protein
MSKLVPVMTRKNFSSGNPGDVFILWGLQYLMEKAFGEKLHWLFLDKFSRNDFAKNQALLKSAGWLIYAGTPQYNNYDDWCLWYDWDVWKEYLIPMKIKFFPIAGGSGFPNPHMTPDEFANYCISSHKTRSILNSRGVRSILTTVRDLHASKLLEKSGIDHEILPCTALWSFDWLGIERSKEELTFLVPPSPKAVGLDVAGMQTYEEVCGLVKSRFLELRDELLKQGHDVRIVCHGPVEYDLFCDVEDCIYIDDAISLLRQYSDAAIVVSSRLHGALPAYGGGSRVLSIPVDTRGSAVDLVGMTSIPFSEWNTESILAEIGCLKPIDTAVLDAARDKYFALFREYMGDFVWHM